MNITTDIVNARKFTNRLAFMPATDFLKKGMRLAML
jgi:hypothetical protein